MANRLSVMSFFSALKVSAIWKTIDWAQTNQETKKLGDKSAFPKRWSRGLVFDPVSGSPVGMSVIPERSGVPWIRWNHFHRWANDLMNKRSFRLKHSTSKRKYTNTDQISIHICLATQKVSFSTNHGSNISVTVRAGGARWLSNADHGFERLSVLERGGRLLTEESRTKVKNSSPLSP